MEVATVTVEDLKILTKDLFTAWNKYEASKSVSSEDLKEYEKLEAQTLATLEGLNLRTFDSEYGKLETRKRETVKIPQGDNREKFFDYLKERGVFDKLITVNSQTLNSWYKEEAELARGEKRFLRIPGIEMPEARVSLIMKSKKES